MPTPFVSKRAPIYADVPDEKWNDWRWQLSHRLNTAEEIEKVLPLTESERKALNTSGLFRVDITPYFISLIDPDDPDDPIRKQVIPLAEEMQSFTAMMEDSLAEDRHSPVPGLVHRYPDRVLMLVTTQCASYCRYCTRSRIVGDPGQTFNLDYSVMHTLPWGDESRLQVGLVGYNQRQTTDKRGPSITPEQAESRYKVNSLGFGASVNLPGRVNVGFKYFQEFSNKSTFQGHSIQISGSIKL